MFVVEDFVGGERVGEVVKLNSSDNDLFTVWILRMFYAMFVPVLRDGTVLFSALDDTGVSRTFNLKLRLVHGDATVFSTHVCPGGVRVRYGLSSTPPSRTNFRLLQEIYVDSNPQLLIDEGRGFVMVESVVAFGADTTICEVGLSLYGAVVGSDVCGEFLLDRTVFSPCRTIPANIPYTVRYRVQL